MRAPNPASLSHHTKNSAFRGFAASRAVFVRAITTSGWPNRKHTGSNRKQTSRNFRQHVATDNSLSQGFRKLSATPGNLSAYVDIVGVTGSIPVAPTSFYDRLAYVPKAENSVRSIHRRQPLTL